MHILITNDDGVQAPGLVALANALKPLGQVTILAPDRNWSAAGHVKTMHRPLRVWETLLADGTQALTSDGAPSDCVALALLGLIKDPIDIVVSGINPLANIGHDLTYSGTVTAALEAAIEGLSGFACSIHPPDGFTGEIDYNPAAVIIAGIVDQAMSRPLPKPFLLNINVPLLEQTQIQGIAITRQGMRAYRNALVTREDPRGRRYYWIGGDRPSGIAEAGTDYWALANGYVSVTPLTLDLTAVTLLPALEAWDLTL